jgi:hypothetical protein
MSGITSWNELIVRKIARYGNEMRIYCSYVIGPHYEGKHFAGQVMMASPSSSL